MVFKVTKILLFLFALFAFASNVNAICKTVIPTQTSDDFLTNGKKEFAKGNYSVSIELFEKALKLNPKAKEVNFLAGLAEYNLKDFKKAKKYFSKEVKINHTYVDAYIYRAKSNKGSYKKALNDLQKAVILSDKNPEVYLARAELNYDYKKYDKAFDDYSLLVKLKPNLDDAYYKMGFCKYFLNDSISACEYWNKIDDLDDFEGVSQIAKICNSIK